LEWAAYAAIRARNEEEMRRLLEEALRRGAAPHVPAQLHDALGEFDDSVGYWEVAVLEPGGERAVPGLIHSLAAVGETERAHRVIERAYESHPTAEIVEWRVWSLLQRDDVDEAMVAVETGAAATPSPWGLHVFQTAALRAGHHEASIEFGAQALASDVDKSIIDTIRYNRACSYAQLGHIGAALAELRSFGDPDLLTHAAGDPDLAPLRPSPEFQAITGSGAAP
jgi:tetratricopeptide (TPR) repeat protein